MRVNECCDYTTVSRVPENLLLRWRATDALVAALALADYCKRDDAFKPVKSVHTERWHVVVKNREFDFLFNGPKFFDEGSRSGGGGAIDLAMHLYGLGFQDATTVLMRVGL